MFSPSSTHRIPKVRTLLPIILVSAALLHSVAAQPAYDPATGTKLRFHRYTLNEGLSQSTIRAIAQDSTGFMWFGTQDGLNKFDGHSFTVFKNDPTDSTSLSDDWVQALYVDSKNNLWIGTRNGLSVFDDHDDSFKRFPPFGTSTGQLIYAILEAPQHRLWVAGVPGLFNLDPKNGQLEHFPIAAEDTADVSHTTLFDVFQDSRGTVWVAGNHGLFQVDQSRKELTLIDLLPQLRGSDEFVSVRGLHETDGHVWVATYAHGLFSLNLDTSEINQFTAQSTDPNGLVTDVLEFCFVDKRGSFWIGTGGAGLQLFDPSAGTFATYVHDTYDVHSLTNNYLLSAFEDRNGDLWFGALGGINRLGKNLTAFQYLGYHPANPNSLSSNFVWSITEDAEGTIWIGTFGSGLTRYSPKENSYTRITYESSGKTELYDNNVGTFLLDSQGRVWIGNRTFLLIYQPETGRIVPVFDALQTGHSAIRSIAEYQDGTIYIATYSGLYSIPPGQASFPIPVTSIKTYDELITGPITLLSDGSYLWIGAGSGLLRFHPPKNQLEPYPHATNEHSVTSLLQDTRGNMWIGTPRGLYYFNPSSGESTHYSEANGVANNYIYGVLPENDHTVWVSTNRGLSRIEHKDDQDDFIRNYSVEDGLQGNEFNTNAYYRLENGDLLFGGTHGLTWFNPSDLSLNTHEPPVVITQVNVFNTPLTLQENLQSIESIELDYFNDEISLDFIALNYRHPERNQYAYRMEGLRNEWNHIDSRRSAYFTNLNPGTYTFHLKAANNDGLWNTAGTSLRIHILPPFWQTLWFRSLMTLCMMGLAYAGYRLRIRKLEQARKDQERLSRKLIETQEEERARIARELHDGLGQNLLLIKNGIDQLKQEHHTLDTQISPFSELAQDTINEVRTISSALHPHQLDKLGLAAALESMVKKTATHVPIKIDAIIHPIDELLNKEQTIFIYRIVQEAINNAVRHAEANVINVRIEDIGASVSLRIEDNGKGFKIENIHNSGLGLAGIQERVRMMHGRFELHSTPGSGTVLHVTIPHAPS